MRSLPLRQRTRHLMTRQRTGERLRRMMGVTEGNKVIKKPRQCIFDSNIALKTKHFKQSRIYNCIVPDIPSWPPSLPSVRRVRSAEKIFGNNPVRIKTTTKQKADSVDFFFMVFVYNLNSIKSKTCVEL